MRDYSIWIHRSVELCLCNGRILLKNSIIWLSGADRIGFLRNAIRSRQSASMARYKLASMNFNTFAEGVFLRLPRSYRVAEKSSQIGTREPNCAVFQQNQTVVTAPLAAPMDPSAINSQA